MKFSDFNLDKRIDRALEELGYVEPTPIQVQAILPCKEGRDILGTAQTGTGKTCAFAVPILHRLGARDEGLGARKIRALVLTPTRELAMQIDESFTNYGKYMPLKIGLVMGGVDQKKQVLSLVQGVDILVATPGRFIDLVWQGYIDPTNIEIFVLDEADRMLDMGFMPDIERVIEFIPEARQTLFFSATMPPEIKKLTQKILTNPVEIAVAPVSSTAEKVEQFVMLTDKAKKGDLLVWALQQLPKGLSSIVFTRTKSGADRLSQLLKKSNVKAKSIHGDKTQSARIEALEAFKGGRCSVLVATDIAARGIDIDDVSFVFNYELPNEPETYVHRIGRTARAGKEGVAVALCDIDEDRYLADIEKLIGKKIPVELNHPFTRKVFMLSKKKPINKNFRRR